MLGVNPLNLMHSTNPCTPACVCPHTCMRLPVKGGSCLAAVLQQYTRLHDKQHHLHACHLSNLHACWAVTCDFVLYLRSTRGSMTSNITCMCAISHTHDLFCVMYRTSGVHAAA
jgi:hypothetical protein